MRRRAAAFAAALLVAAAYGGLNRLTLGWHLPGAAAAVAMRPQIVLPLLAGYLLGPWPGFAAGFAGNLLGVWLGGWGFEYGPFSRGNGLRGAVMGRVPSARTRRIETVGQFSVLLLALAGGNALCIGTGVAIYNLLTPDSLEQLTWAFFHPIVLSNVLASFVLVPPLLFAMRRLSATFDLRLCGTLFYLLILVVVPLVGAANVKDYRGLREGLARAMPPEQAEGLMEQVALADFRVGGTIGIGALLASLAAGFWLVQAAARPVRVLLRAATQLKEGRLDEIRLDGLARKNDELGRLAQVFEEAVGQVRRREDELRRAIEELRVEVDREQAAEQVSGITETDYFRVLREKSMELRARKRRAER